MIILPPWEGPDCCPGRMLPGSHRVAVHWFSACCIHRTWMCPENTVLPSRRLLMCEVWRFPWKVRLVGVVALLSLPWSPARLGVWTVTVPPHGAPPHTLPPTQLHTPRLPPRVLGVGGGGWAVGPLGVTVPLSPLFANEDGCCPFSSPFLH